MEVMEFDILEEISSQQFSLTDEDYNEEENEDSSFYWSIKENPEITEIVTQIERMGFTLATYNDSDMMHKYTSKNWNCYLSPLKECIHLEYRQTSGTMFSEKTMSIKESSVSEIVKSIADSYFLKGDKEIKSMIQQDKRAWNSLYSKEHGQWT